MAVAEKQVEVAYSSAPLTKKKTAQLVATLEALYAKHKVIKAQDLLNEASKASHPLHSEFEWSDKKAAEKYRLSQARQLIASVKIKVLDESIQSEPIRAFVNVRPEPNGDNELLPARGYMPVMEAFQSQNYRRQVLAFAHQQLLRWKQKFGSYKEFSQLVALIEQTKI